MGLSDNSIVPFSSLHEPWQSHQTAGGGNKRKLNQLKDVKLIENYFFLWKKHSPPTTDGIVVMLISGQPQKLTVNRATGAFRWRLSICIQFRKVHRSLSQLVVFTACVSLYCITYTSLNYFVVSVSTSLRLGHHLVASLW